MKVDAVSPTLYNTITSGNCDFLIVKFIILVIGFTTVVWANLRILVEIPSHPVAFLRFSLLICLLINSSLMGWIQMMRAP